jgi:hypothetical protein
MANIQIDLRNSRMTNLNKRPDAKYQEGGIWAQMQIWK